MSPSSLSFFVFLAILGTTFATITYVDDFSAVQLPLTVPGNQAITNSSIIFNSTVLGGSRKMQLTSTGTGSSNGQNPSAYVAGGQFAVANPIAAGSSGAVIYDGSSSGANPATINSQSGFNGGMSFSALGGFFLVSATYDLNDNFTLVVYSNGGQSSFVQQTVGTKASPVQQNFTISFSSFSGNANFNAVTAFVLHSDPAFAVDAYFDFLAIISPAITGTVFYDANCNGVQDNSEQGAAGVTVTATPTSNCPAGSPVLTNNTDVNGNYVFQNAAPCTYTITVPGKNNCQGSPASLSTSNSVTGTSLDIPLKGIPPITGTVFYDSNCDGVQDNSEQGVSGVTVTATPVTSGTNACPSGTPTQTTTTNSAGQYSFSGLSACTYTFSAVGMSNCQGSTPSSITGNTNQVSTVNIPVQTSPPLTGTVFDDANCNGVMDNSEQGVSGVTVTATPATSGADACPAGTPSLTTVTNSAGQYTFSNTKSCAYTISVNGATSCNGGTPSTTTNGQSQGSITNNIPIKQNNAITGTVFFDNNCNGVMDNGEQVVSGIVVTATPSANCPSGTASLTTVTNAAGQYTFSNTANCAYTISVPSAQACNGNTPSTSATPSNSGTTTTANLPVKPSPNISGTVFDDFNCNGVMNSGDSPVAGATVVATPSSNCPAGTPTLTTTTNSNGQYNFTNAAYCSYTVSVPGASTCQGTTSPSSNTVGPSTGGAVVNFPVKPAPTITGTVFGDLNCNGAMDNSEQGVGGGITVTATPTSNCPAGAADLTTTTNSNGQYTFNNVDACTYTITAPGQANCQGNTPTGSAPAGQTSSGSSSTVVTVNLPVRASTLTPPGPISISCSSPRTPTYTGNATATGGSGSLTYTDSPVTYPNGPCGNGQFTRTFSYGGQTATQVITLAAPTSGPTYTYIPSSTTVGNGQSSSPQYTGTPTAVDACGLPVTITYTDAVGSSSCSQQCVSTNNIIRTFTASDGCYSTNVTQAITVNGNAVNQPSPVPIGGTSATPTPGNIVNICPSYTPLPCPSVADVVCPGGAVSGSSTITFSLVLLVISAVFALF